MKNVTGHSRSVKCQVEGPSQHQHPSPQRCRHYCVDDHHHYHLWLRQQQHIFIILSVQVVAVPVALFLGPVRAGASVWDIPMGVVRGEAAGKVDK